MSVLSEEVKGDVTLAWLGSMRETLSHVQLMG